MLTVPERRFNFGGQVLSLAPTSRCFYGVEQATDFSYEQTVRGFCRLDFRSVCILAYHLTATDRARQRLCYPLTADDKAQGYSVPPGFLDILPPPPSEAWWQLLLAIQELLQEAGLTETKAEAPAKQVEIDTDPGPI